MTEVYQGKIKWFNLEKGYGFIFCHQTKKDIFFHVDQLIVEGFLNPKEGEKVSFQKVNTEKGSRAINIYIEK